MLSHNPVSSGQAASGYYKSEGYYIADTPEAENSAIYYGKAALEAGLIGPVNDEQFSALLDGQTPDGRLLGNYQGGERRHRAGIDLTFSAPKGVSIAALVGGDTRIIQAHTEAVKVALDYVEANLIETRRQVHGENIRETGGKIIAGVFQHDTSRELDPQLHSHAVITNIVKDSTGSYRSMANERFFDKGRVDGRVATTIFLGQIYRSALSEKLEALGYETFAREKGLFDIKGIPEELVEQFSKRRKEIEAALKERGMQPNSYNSQLAALATRSAKKPVERAELHQAWDAEVKALGIDLEQAMQDAKKGARVHESSKDERVDLAVRFAVSHHGERNSIYPRAAVVHSSMKFVPGITEAAVSSKIDEMIEAGTLFSVEHDKGRFLTDVRNVRLEKENIQMMGRLKGRPVLDLRSKAERITRRSSDAVIARKLAKTSLTTGQKEAVALTLSSSSGVVGVQGYAGTGKTYALATAVRMAEARGYAIDGIAPSHKAVSALAEAIPNHSTVESLLVRFENGANLGGKSRSILVVDEASMLSSEGMNRVLRMARGAGYARLVLVGDVKQLEAVGAGSAFRALQNAGMPTATMTDIQRQRTEEGRQAVLSAIKGDVREALNGVTSVIETGGKGREEIRANIASDLAATYSALPLSERENTGLIVLTNDMRRDVNLSIQNQLKVAGEIGGGEAKISSLVPKNFTQAEAAEIGSYKVGDIVVSPIAAPRSGLVSNTLYDVAGVDVWNKRLTLSGPSGETVTLDLHWKSRVTQKLAVFGREDQTFIEGDRVKFKITDREHGVVNSAEGTFVRAGRTVIGIETDTGEVIAMPTNSLAAKGMQLAYATTAHDFQGSTVNRVLLGISSEEQLSTQKAFYVALSRMRDETQIVTDDLNRLVGRIQSDTGERINALEALADERNRQTAPGSRPVLTETQRTIAPAKDQENTSQIARRESDKDRDPNLKTSEKTERIEADKSDRNEERQLSLLEQIEKHIEREQKTRDERSR